jgi:hypothetical protein
MKTTPISVVICGLVRDVDRLMKKVVNYRDWHEQGQIDQIIYATWIDELDRYPGLRKSLQEHGVTILEIEEPRLILKGGHQLHQMTAFHYALAALEDYDQFVLKTRVDLADNNEIMLHEFANGTPPADDFAQFGLKNLILVENAQMFYPFLCGDAQFFGRLSDLRKLINMSAGMEMTMNRLAVEQTFFFQPFADSRLFQRHFYWNLPHISEIADRRSQQLAFVLNKPVMQQAIKAWWLIMNSYFKVGWGPVSEDIPAIASLEQASSYEGPGKIIGGDRSDVINNDIFVRALMRLLPPDEQDTLKLLIRDRGSDNPFAVPPAIFDEYDVFRRQFSDLPSAKAIRAGSQKRVITGAAQHFFVKQAQDEASTRYHEQVTALRRENDYLKSQLNITFTNTPLHRMLNRVLPRKLIVFMKYRMTFLTNLYSRYLMRKRGK